MLHEFLTTHRLELIDLCRARVSARRAPRATPVELEYGIPLFLDQLTNMLSQGTGKPPDAPASPAGETPKSSIDGDARKHGAELLRHDFTIDQVVHDYGDLCQSITELAVRRGSPITVAEFGNLNIRLDNAIANAVGEFAREGGKLQMDQDALALNGRLGELARDLRNRLNIAILAIAAIRGGGVGFGGATAAALDLSLLDMRALIDSELTRVRLEAGTAIPRESIEIGPFIAEIRVAAALEASRHGCSLTVSPVEPGLFVEGDHHILAAAVANILQNALKFTRAGSHVTLRARGAEGRVLIEVEDECGGLAPEVASSLSHALEPGSEGAGLGSGLSLSRTGVESLGGVLRVFDIRDQGCIFRVDLPRGKA